jgi:hypothetical protein
VSADDVATGVEQCSFFDRERHDFTERDRTVVNTLAPHLQQGTRHDQVPDDLVRTTIAGVKRGFEYRRYRLY